MTEAACASCLSPLLPHVDLCFDCDLSSAAPPPVQKTLRRFGISGTARDSDRLAKAIAALCPELPAATVAAFSRRPSFDIVAELALSQESGLIEWIQSSGAQVAPLPEDTSPSRVWRFEFNWLTGLQLGMVAALAVTAQVLSIPAIPTAGGVMGFLLVGQAVHLDAAELRIAPNRVEALLGPVDSRVLDQIRSARRAARHPDVVARLRAPVLQFIEVSSALRRNRAESTEVRRAESETASTLAQLVRMIATVERLSEQRGAEVSAAESYRSAQSKLVSAAVRQLGLLAGALETLRASPTITPASVARTMIQQRADIETTIASILSGN